MNIKYLIKNIFKYLILFLIGGTAYYIIEILWRGYSHWTMFILGGLCFISCGLINNLFGWDVPLWKQMLLCSILITVFEFIAGVIINIIFQLNVWDYSEVPFNIMGQICILYTFLWFLLSPIAIIVDDYCRYVFFDEDFPKYKWK